MRTRNIGTNTGAYESTSACESGTAVGPVFRCYRRLQSDEQLLRSMEDALAQDELHEVRSMEDALAQDELHEVHSMEDALAQDELHEVHSMEDALAQDELHEVHSMEDALAQDELHEVHSMEDALAQDALAQDALAQDALAQDALAQDALAQDELHEVHENVNEKLITLLEEYTRELKGDANEVKHPINEDQAQLISDLEDALNGLM